MVWDVIKSTGDLITSSDWNDMVTDQKGHSARHESGGTDQLDLGGLSASSDIDMGSVAAITNLPSPESADESARKSYVDSVAQGLNLKDSVAVSDHDQQIDLTSTTDPNPIDGYTLSDGERILLKHQNDASKNGIYDANTATDPSTWTRSSDFDEDDEVTEGSFTFIENGTEHANTSYILVTSDPISVGTDDQNWTQFAAAGEIKGGTLLTKNNNTLNVEEGAISHDSIDQSTVSSGDHHVKTTSSDIDHDQTVGGTDADAHHTRYTDEESQDAAEAMITGGSEILTTYDDANNSLTIDFVGQHVIGVEDNGTQISDTIQTLNFGQNLDVQTNVGTATIDAPTDETVSYETGHTAWADGLSNSEIHRINLQSGETFVLERIEFRQKGGGSSSNASVDVYDNTAASVIGSQNLGGTTKDAGSSGSGNTILVRINNSTGGSINASVRVVGYIEGA